MTSGLALDGRLCVACGSDLADPVKPYCVRCDQARRFPFRTGGTVTLTLSAEDLVVYKKYMASVDRRVKEGLEETLFAFV